MLGAFQNVADSLAALEHDAEALDASSRAALSARGAYDDAAARVRLGALPPSAARASELQYRNARLDEIRATGARFADTARLYQAMGTPPVDKTDKADQSGKTDKSADAAATGQQARAADADTPPAPQ